MKLLTFADGVIRLGGEEVPGILQSLTIDGKVRYDEQKVDGQSGKSKTPQGFEDQTVKATLVLLTDDESDCYEKLALLAPFFRKTDEHANPQIYALANRHSQTRGIRRITRKLRPYDLRHAFATLALDHSADISSVAEVMGHRSKVMILQYYRHTSARQRRRAVNAAPSLGVDKED